MSFAGEVPGQVLNSRQVTVAGLGPAITSFQVQYVSENTSGAPQANVATILKPLLGSSPPRLVSYGIPIDSLSYNCDPSYTLRMGSEKEVADIAVLLARGWTVVVADFLGPDHEWVAAYVEGRGTLDGIRAAENFAPSGLSGNSTPVATMGYSGGARGAEFANELAATYAPELNIVGAAPGGLAVNAADVLRTTDGGAFAGVDFAGTLGLDRAYPSVGISSLLNARGQQMQRDIATMCIAQFTATYATQKIESYTTNGVDPLGLGAFQAVLAQNLGGHLGTPTAPTYLYVAGNDELIVPATDDKLVAQYCAQGLTVQYVKYVSDHVTAQDEGYPAAIAWIADRFAGKPAPNTCTG